MSCPEPGKMHKVKGEKETWEANQALHFLGVKQTAAPGGMDETLGSSTYPGVLMFIPLSHKGVYTSKVGWTPGKRAMNVGMRFQP